ncbi:hypothetical protein DFJ73DRAFT_766037 [Zopfochytrium polystomum]|nr:hypothetical protein DFJ73DRAFT_766037 [Zopfochytrium polystomum]
MSCKGKEPEIPILPPAAPPPPPVSLSLQPPPQSKSQELIAINEQFAVQSSRRAKLQQIRCSKQGSSLRVTPVQLFAAASPPAAQPMTISDTSSPTGNAAAVVVSSKRISKAESMVLKQALADCHYAPVEQSALCTQLRLTAVQCKSAVPWVQEWFKQNTPKTERSAPTTSKKRKASPAACVKPKSMKATQQFDLGLIERTRRGSSSLARPAKKVNSLEATTEHSLERISLEDSAPFLCHNVDYAKTKEMSIAFWKSGKADHLKAIAEKLWSTLDNSDNNGLVTSLNNLDGLFGGLYPCRESIERLSEVITSTQDKQLHL